MKKDIKNLTIDELIIELSKMPEPSYRAKQIFSWLYQRNVEKFSAMSDIPNPLQKKLESAFFIGQIELARHLISSDKTEKFLFKLSGGEFVETVLIPAKDRMTLCISTQVGCKYACAFCASGSMGFTRNLSVSEILSQILFVKHGLKRAVTNFVFMGMGEPLDNFENLSKAIMIMNDPKGLRLAARRITVSTSGVIPGIKRFGELNLQINLSISLHAANGRLRNELMPINKKYPLAKLIEECQEYISSGGRMLTFEYIVIKGKNSSLKDADGLAGLAKKLRAKVNIIPYSEIKQFKFEAPAREEVDTFKKRLEARGVNVTVRESKGKDIHAACGQLAGCVKE